MDFRITHAAIMACLQTGSPVKLQSDPGTGKTSYARSLADAAGRYFELVLPSVCDPTDFGGIPYNHEGKMLISIPWFVQRCQQAFLEGRLPLVLYDEVTNATRAVMGAMLSGVQTGFFGSGRLPVGAWQMFCCNPPETAAEGTDLPAPMANRTFHFDWKPTTGDWVKGMLAGFPEPEVLIAGPSAEVATAKWRQMIAAYLHNHTGAAYVLPEEEVKRSEAWPSYRSWCDLAGSALGQLDAMPGVSDILRDVQLKVISASIGDAHGLAFLTWMDSLDLPNPEELLKNPGSFEPNVRGDINFTALTSVAQVVAENLTDDRYLQGWAVMEVAAKKGLTAQATTAARSLAKLRDRNPKLPVPSKALVPFAAILRKYGLLKDGK